MAEQSRPTRAAGFDRFGGANQGVFKITRRDAAGGDRSGNDDQGSIDKKVRLVTTVDYYMID